MSVREDRVTPTGRGHGATLRAVQPLALNPSAIFAPGSVGAPWAAVTQTNLLGDPVFPRAERVVAWSGWLDPAARPERGQFARDFRIWMSEGWTGLEHACDAVLPALGQQRSQLLLRPHSRLVLSDPQSCVSFFRARANQPIRLLLDAAAMLTPAMLPTVEDHLARIFQALGPHPAAAAVLLASVRPGSTEDDDLLAPVPLHRGLVDPGLILGAWRAACPPELPVVLLEAEFEAQAELLGAGR
jgi:hypothetical protein